MPALKNPDPGNPPTMTLTTTELTGSTVVTFSSVLHSSSFSVVACRRSEGLVLCGLNKKKIKILKTTLYNATSSKNLPHLHRHPQLLPCPQSHLLYLQHHRQLAPPPPAPLQPDRVTVVLTRAEENLSARSAVKTRGLSEEEG